MHLFRIVLFIFLFFSTQGLMSQRALGTWKDYLNYSQAVDVTILDHKIYTATRNAVFIYDTHDHGFERLNKVKGLSDVDIVSIHADAFSGSVFVGYANGNLDILQEKKIYNFAAIKNSSVVGDKAIRHITFHNNTAFISTGVGLLEFDIGKREVRETYTISSTGNISINETAIIHDTIFAATNEGLYFGHLSSDLSIFSNWEIDLSNPSPFADIKNCTVQDDDLFINIPSASVPGLYKRQSDYTWVLATATPYINKVNSSPAGLLVNAGFFVELKQKNGTSNALYISSYGGHNASVQNITADANGHIWIADKNNGLVKYYTDGSVEIIYPDGPATNNAFDLDFKHGQLWVATGAPERPGTWNNKFLLEGFYSFIDGKWKNYNRQSNPELLDMLFFDAPKVFIDPDEKDLIYVGSFFSGFTVVKDGEIEGFYSDYNTSLGPRTEYPRDDGYSWVGVAGMAKDWNGNMWFTNSFAASPLSVKTKSGTWKSFNLLGPNGIGNNKNLLNLIVDRQNQIWALINRGGIAVFDPGQSIADESDDKVRLLTAEIGKGGLPSNEVICITEDLEGEIWIGTMDGIGVFYSPYDVLNDNFSDARKILVQQNGIYQYLLEGQAVSAIAVDGANRKWIGTTGAGLFLMSPNGTEEILRFTYENSPLISNTINDIVIDPKTGEVFIATSQGIVSYMSDATSGGLSNDCLSVYPNPLRSDFEGSVSITGLLRDSQIRITDARGNLIYKTVSNGGRAVWDGKNTIGEKVTTGVYFILATDDAGESTCVNKVLVIK